MPLVLIHFVSKLPTSKLLRILFCSRPLVTFDGITKWLYRYLLPTIGLGSSCFQHKSNYVLAWWNKFPFDGMASRWSMLLVFDNAMVMQWLYYAMVICNGYMQWLCNGCTMQWLHRTLQCKHCSVKSWSHNFYWRVSTITNTSTGTSTSGGTRLYFLYFTSCQGIFMFDSIKPRRAILKLIQVLSLLCFWSSSALSCYLMILSYILKKHESCFKYFLELPFVFYL